MSKSADAAFLDDRLGGNVVRFLGTNGPAIYADGAVGTPNPPVPGPTGNPWIDPTSGERFPGAPT